MSDRPGGISELTRCIADAGVSIKDIYHERAWLQSRLDQVMVKVTAETTGREHSKQLKLALQQKVGGCHGRCFYRQRQQLIIQVTN